MVFFVSPLACMFYGVAFLSLQKLIHNFHRLSTVYVSIGVFPLFPYFYCSHTFPKRSHSSESMYMILGDSMSIVASIVGVNRKVNIHNKDDDYSMIVVRCISKSILNLKVPIIQSSSPLNWRMEPPKDGRITGVTVIAPEAPSEYHVAPRVESSQATGNPPPFSLGQGPSSQATGNPPPYASSGPSTGMAGSFERKKRGRPRKYGPDGVMGSASGVILSPTPISAKPLPDSGPDGQQGTQPPSGGFPSDKKGKAQVNASGARPRQAGTEDLGEGASLSTGGTFVPHVLNVNPGEDVSQKIMDLSREGPRTVCIIGGSGSISNVTLRQTNSFGAIRTFEGLFDIVSITGSFVPSKAGGFHFGKNGGISISLTRGDGRVVGGVLAGVLIAASEVQIVAGSFLPSGYVDPKQKRTKSAPKPPAEVPMGPPMPSHAANVEHPVFDSHEQSQHGATGEQGQHGATGIGSSSASDLNSDDWGDMNLGPDPGRPTTDINIPFQGE